MIEREKIMEKSGDKKRAYEKEIERSGFFRGLGFAQSVTFVIRLWNWT